jgi:hypothetical protein
MTAGVRVGGNALFLILIIAKLPGFFHFYLHIVNFIWPRSRAAAEPSRKKSGVPFRVPIFILDGPPGNTLPDGGGFPQGAIPHVRPPLTFTHTARHSPALMAAHLP